MHRQIYDDRNEFEPRITPKPVTKFDFVTAPSVPEVSLIFDKSGETRRLGTKSPSASLERSKSYAEWREQNFSQRTSNPYTNSAKIQRNESENTLQRRNPSPNIQSPNKGNRTPKKVVENFRKNEEYEKFYTNYRHIPANTHFMQQDCDRNHATQQYNASLQNDSRVPQSTSHSSFNSPCKSQPPVDSISLYKERQGLYPCSPSNRNLIVQKDRTSSDINNTMNKLLSENSHLKANTFTKNGFPPMLHPAGHPYTYTEMNPCTFPPFYPAVLPNHGIDNNETVKNLLQLVNNQSEQIKSLQGQIDRLLKMQEESLKERARCSCSAHICQQTESGSYSTINASNTLVSQNQSVMRNTYQNPAVQQNEHNSISNEAKTDNDVQVIQSELQSRKALLEQKVSIGVMTSFEFTVQNSPFLTESEDYEARDLHQTDLIGKKNGFIYPDGNETHRRNKSSYPRAVGAPLENIVEDSESHLSSSHQQSSNFNASCSTKDLQERQSNSQTLKESDASNTHYNQQQSPRPRDTILETSNQDKIASLNSREKYNEKEEMRHNKKNHLMHAGGRLAGENNKVNIESTKRYRSEDAQRNIMLKDSLDKARGYQNHQNGKYSSNVQSDNCVEESLVLSGADLNVEERPPPTPDPSIHVDIKEYYSDEESDKVTHSPKVGWTFYNNVLGQVNQILQNSQMDDAKEPKDTRTANNTERNTAENKVLIDTVKNATLEQLRKLGISLCENTDTRDSGKKPVYDSSYYPRLDYQANMTQGTSSIPETNTSMHMKALALKYLSDDQLAELAMQKQGSASMKHLMLSNMQGTNMSFATMRYLERYQLLPGKNNAPTEGNDKVGTVEPPKPETRAKTPIKQGPALQRYPFTQTPRTTCPSKILDISTLKQQPKLL